MANVQVPQRAVNVLRAVGQIALSVVAVALVMWAAKTVSGMLQPMLPHTLGPLEWVAAGMLFWLLKDPAQALRDAVF
ncbi:MAG: hypothetical protein AAFR28_18355 [Pseudomonadota bacterium]